MDKKLYFAGSLSFIVLGAGHLLIDLLSKYILGPPDIEVYNAMLSFKINIFGFTRNLVEFMDGFSLTMGTLMIFYGVLNIILLKKMKYILLKTSAVHLFNSLVSVVLVLFSFMYFHWPPIIFFFISALCYSIVFFRNRRRD